MYITFKYMYLQILILFKLFTNHHSATVPANVVWFYTLHIQTDHLTGICQSKNLNQPHHKEICCPVVVLLLSFILDLPHKFAKKDKKMLK